MGDELGDARDLKPVLGIQLFGCNAEQGEVLHYKRDLLSDLIAMEFAPESLGFPE